VFVCSSQCHMTLDEKKRRLIESLRLLAGDREVQWAAFPEFVHKPDEIALVFDETRRFVDELVDAEAISGEQARLIRQIDVRLDDMSGESKAALWTYEALGSDANWEAVRRMAKNVLNALSAEMSRPRIDWAAYVKG
jgi:hypothetical protein